MAAKDWQSARRFSRWALIQKPDDPDLIMQVATVEAMCDHKKEAAQLMIQAAQAADYNATLVDYAVHALIDVGEIYGAIEFLQNAVDARPEQTAQRITLIGLLKEAQRNQLIEPHYERLIRDRNFNLGFLVDFTDIPNRKFSTSAVEMMLQRNPDDLRIQLGEAQDLLDHQEASEARKILEMILAKHPDFAPAHALLGQALVAEDQFAVLNEWISRAPQGTGTDASEAYASYWLTLGDWASNENQHAGAARAYWEATKRDANDTTAWTRLALSIRRLRAAGFEGVRAITDSQLEGIHRRIDELLLMRKHFTSFSWSNRTSQRDATEVARSLSKLGRNWEAEAWSAVATTLQSDPADDLASLRNVIVQALKVDPSWLSMRENLELSMDLSVLPLPEIGGESRRTPENHFPGLASHDHLRMIEASARWGLKGIGANNDLSDPRRSPLLRSIGVGGGAIDYDLDGRVDAIVMGAGGTVTELDSFPNELLRNVGMKFVRVTHDAGVGMRDFGQGLGVGDFNEDGFSDVFFANAGVNRLLRNNGDGTFTDCSQLLEGSDIEEWTTCGAFVDVNDDGITDLITTNYCKLEGHPDQPCPNAEGELGPCHPLRFSAEANRFFVAVGDGRMRNDTSKWSANVAPGRSLGVVAGTLAEDTLGILIVNDMTANELYTKDENRVGRFVESAAARGVAVDGNTRTQASMGIASGDLDRDGDLDFYVTGFAGEHNILYEQVAPGCWLDTSHSFGMVRPTLPTVGFGTNAIDLDGDGYDELMVTNGHIGEFDDGYVYAQPFQVFGRTESGKFALVDDDHWGKYFSTPHVGRALWALDVDGDRRDDIMITHTKEQVRLLLNRTKEDHHRIEFKLVGRASSRDAVGSIVRFKCDGQPRTLWLLSGNGFMCCDEQVLRAGLGDSDRLDEVTVEWPDGTVDELGSLDADFCYLMVQGDAEAFQLDGR